MGEHLTLVVVVLVVLVELTVLVRVGQTRIWRAGVRAPWVQLGWSMIGLVLGAVNLGTVAVLGGGPDRRAALVAAALPAFTGLLLQHELMLVRTLEPLTGREHQAGRQEVLDVAHGALSTNLRLLEQRAARHRSTDPGLTDLAVSLNSRLREILALADAGLRTSETPSSLRGPIQTRVSAYGANARVTIRANRLSESDHERLLLAVTLLVDSALAAGAANLDVRLVSRAGRVVLEVGDDSAMAPVDRPDHAAMCAVLAEHRIRSSHTVRRGLTQHTAVLARDLG